MLSFGPPYISPYVPHPLDVCPPYGPDSFPSAIIDRARPSPTPGTQALRSLHLYLLRSLVLLRCRLGLGGGKGGGAPSSSTANIPAYSLVFDPLENPMPGCPLCQATLPSCPRARLLSDPMNIGGSLTAIGWDTGGGGGGGGKSSDRNWGDAKPARLPSAHQEGRNRPGMDTMTHLDVALRGGRYDVVPVRRPPEVGYLHVELHLRGSKAG